MKLKLTTLAAVAIAALSTGDVAARGTYINTAPSTQLFKSGFTVGAAFGYSQMKTKFNEEFLLINNFSDNANANSHAFVGEISFGYRHLFHNGYVVGTNISFSADTDASKKSTELIPTIESKTKLTRLFQVSPSLLLGKTIGHWMPFVKFGLSISRFRLKHISDDAFRTVRLKTKISFVPAIGIEYALNKNFSVTTSASYEHFKSWSQSFPVDPTPGSSGALKMKPRYITAKIGVLWKI